MRLPGNVDCCIFRGSPILAQKECPALEDFARVRVGLLRHTTKQQFAKLLNLSMWIRCATNEASPPGSSRRLPKQQPPWHEGVLRRRRRPWSCIAASGSVRTEVDKCCSSAAEIAPVQGDVDLDMLVACIEVARELALAEHLARQQAARPASARAAKAGRPSGKNRAMIIRDEKCPCDGERPLYSAGTHKNHTQSRRLHPSDGRASGLHTKQTSARQAVAGRET